MKKMAQDYSLISSTTDTKKSTDYKSSIKAAGKGTPPEKCNTQEEFKEYRLKEITQLSTGKIVDLKELTEESLALFCQLLSNRSILDQNAKEAEGSLFVDQSRRDRLIASYTHDFKGMLHSQKSDASALEEALFSVHSYQVDHNAHFDSNLTKEHLVNATRSSVLDEVLIENALNLTQTILTASKERSVIREGETWRNVSENKEINATYTLTKGAIHTADDFDLALREQISLLIQQKSPEKEGISQEGSRVLGLYAAFLDLTTKEQNLFFKALTTRVCLDVSSNEIEENGNKQYVNPFGRNQLQSEYATTGDVLLSKGDIE